MSTNQHPDHTEQQHLFDLVTLVSYLRTSIASARLSERSPSVFDLECLETLQYALEGIYASKCSSLKNEQDQIAAAIENIVTSGAK